jgi:kumamolisin
MKTSRRTGRVVLGASHRTPPKGAKLSGKLSPDQRIEVTLRLRRKAGAAKPSARSDGKALTREQFRDAFGADPADLEKIEQFADDHELEIAQSSIAQRSVRLSGSIAAMESAFGVTLKCYETAGAKRYFRGRTGPVTIPRAIAPIVEAVFGLDDRPQARPHFRVHPPRAAAKMKPMADGAKPLRPTDVARLYNFPKNLDGAGQCIAIIELGGGYRTKDLSAYFKFLGLKKPKVAAISVSGGHNDPDGPSRDANGEVMLDIEVAGAIAPAAKIAVYFAPNTDEGFLNALHTAIHDNVRKPSVVSISWGSSESNWTAQAMNDFDSACADGAAMGVTVTVSAGDNGAPDNDDPAEKRANVDFPASSPNVLACGGTRLVAGPQGVAQETVWNNHNGAATGGGVSDVFPLPKYQKKKGVPKSINPGGKVRRGVPDIAGNADPETGYIVRVDGEMQAIGGTSAVSPLWAGLIALLNQGRPTKPVGFINPKLYHLAASNGALHDITVGDNGVNRVKGYAAKKGWDACTGLGTPDGAQLLATV